MLSTSLPANPLEVADQLQIANRSRQHNVLLTENILNQSVFTHLNQIQKKRNHTVTRNHTDSKALLQKTQRELRKTLFRLSQVVTDGKAESIELHHMKPKEIDLEPTVPVFAYIRLRGHRPPCYVQLEYIEPGDIKVYVSHEIARPTRERA